MTPPTSPSKRHAPAKPRGDAFVQAVLEATLAELAAQGYERLSIPQIAILADANKTSIYRRWPSKAELVRDALASVITPASQAPDTGHLQGDLLELAKNLAAFLQSPAGKAIVSIMLTQSEDSELRALAQTSYQNAHQQAPFIVMQRAMQRGELKAQIDPAQVLFTLAGSVMHRLFVERSVADEAFLKQAIEIVLRGAGHSELPL
jgi:AcrR family transcriptional regulator